MIVTLPFPPAILSGHANGNGRWKKIAETKRQRENACKAVKDMGGMDVPESGDIKLHIHFVPPDRRGDRVGYWNRCKALIDGIADGIDVNDRRFLPSMSFSEPKKPGCVIVEVG